MLFAVTLIASSFLVGSKFVTAVRACRGQVSWQRTANAATASLAAGLARSPSLAGARASPTMMSPEASANEGVQGLLLGQSRQRAEATGELFDSNDQIRNGCVMDRCTPKA